MSIQESIQIQTNMLDVLELAEEHLFRMNVAVEKLQKGLSLNNVNLMVDATSALHAANTLKELKTTLDQLAATKYQINLRSSGMGTALKYLQEFKALAGQGEIPLPITLVKNRSLEMIKKLIDGINVPVELEVKDLRIDAASVEKAVENKLGQGLLKALRNSRDVFDKMAEDAGKMANPLDRGAQKLGSMGKAASALIEDLKDQAEHLDETARHVQRAGKELSVTLDPAGGGGNMARGGGFKALADQVTLVGEKLKEGEKAGERFARNLRGGMAALMRDMSGAIETFALETKEAFTLAEGDGGTLSLIKPEVASRLMNLIDTMQEVGATSEQMKRVLLNGAGAINAANQATVNSRKAMDQANISGAAYIRLMERLVDETQDVAWSTKNAERATKLMAQGLDDASGVATTLAAVRRGEIDVLSKLGPEYQHYLKYLNQLPLAQRKIAANQLLDKWSRERESTGGLANSLGALNRHYGMLMGSVSRFMALLGPVGTMVGGAVVAAFGALAAGVTASIVAFQKSREELRKWSQTADETAKARENMQSQLVSAFALGFEGDNLGKFDSAATQVMESLVPRLEAMGRGLASVTDQALADIQHMIPTVMRLLEALTPLSGLWARVFSSDDAGNAAEDVDGVAASVSGLTRAIALMMDTATTLLTLPRTLVKGLALAVVEAMRWVANFTNETVKVTKSYFNSIGSSVGLVKNAQASILKEHKKISEDMHAQYDQMSEDVDNWFDKSKDAFEGVGQVGVDAIGKFRDGLRGQMDLIRDDIDRLMQELSDALDAALAMSATRRSTWVQALGIDDNDALRSALMSAEAQVMESKERLAAADAKLAAKAAKIADAMQLTLSADDLKAKTKEEQRQVKLAFEAMRAARQRLQILQAQKDTVAAIVAANEKAIQQTHELNALEKLREARASMLGADNVTAINELLKKERLRLQTMQKALEIEKARLDAIEAARQKQLGNAKAGTGMKELTIDKDAALARKKELEREIESQTRLTNAITMMAVDLRKLSKLTAPGDFSSIEQATLSVPGLEEKLADMTAQADFNASALRAVIHQTQQEIVKIQESDSLSRDEKDTKLRELFKQQTALTADLVRSNDRLVTNSERTQQLLEVAKAIAMNTALRDNQTRNLKWQMDASKQIQELAGTGILEMRQVGREMGMDIREAQDRLVKAQTARANIQMEMLTRPDKADDLRGELAKATQAVDQAQQDLVSISQETAQTLINAKEAESLRLINIAVAGFATLGQAAGQSLGTFLEDLQDTTQGNIGRRFDMMLDRIEDSFSDVGQAVGTSAGLAIGNAWGPIGGMIGMLVGSLIEGLWETDEERRRKKEERQREREERERKEDERHREALAALRELLAINNGIYDNTGAFLEGNRRIENLTVAGAGLDRRVRQIARDQQAERRLYDN